MNFKDYLNKVYTEAPIDLVPKVVPKATNQKVNLTVRLRNGDYQLSIPATNVDVENSVPGQWKLTDAQGFLNDLREAISGQLANVFGGRVEFTKDVAEKLKQTGVTKDIIEFNTERKSNVTMLSFSGEKAK